MRASEEKLRLLTSNLTDVAIFTTDPEGLVTSWNAGAARIQGYVAEEVLGKPCSIFSLPEDAAAGKPNRAIQLAARNGRLEEEGWRVRKDGSRFFAHDVTEVLRESSGTLRGFAKITRDLTERSEADAGIARLAAIVESSQDAIVGKDLTGTILSWNQGAERLYGYTRAEAVGRSATILVPPEGIDDDRNMMECIRRSEPVSTVETTRLRKDGSRVEVSLSISPVKDAYGVIVGASVIARDITERPRAEQALRKSEERFRRMADDAPVMIWMSDTDKSCIWFNKPWLDFVGQPMEQELGNGWAKNVHPDDLDACLRTYNAAFDAREPFLMEYRVKRHDGEYRWLLDHGAPLRGTNREFTGYIGSCVDINERKQGEARLHAVLETAIDSIITIDGRGRVQSVNAATERMFGYAAAEAIGQNISMLMPPPYREEHDGYLARYLKTGEKRIIGSGREVQGQRKDGTIFPVDLTVSEVEPGRLFTGIIRDISDRKLGEARLHQVDRMASIGTLAAGLGHDMNNVLLPVRAHLNVLKVGGDDALMRREHLDEIQKGVAYLQQLADGLHFLAMDPDQIDEVGGSTDLQVWWRQTGALLSKAVPKHVKVMVSLPTGLPEIAIAAHALTQAVLNLIVNAGEAIPAPPQRKRRQGYVRLWAKPDPEQSHVKLGVTDNGSGMTEEVKRRAFDMFFTTKPRGLGTGLGLPMVRKVVDRAGGSVQVDSELGKGTTVALNLPTADYGNDIGDELVAAIRIGDGRAASLVRSLLEAFGANVNGGTDLHEADIWVVDPSAADVSEARVWRSKRPQGRLVLFGRPEPPGAAGWHALQALTIEDPSDLEAVRTTLGLAIAKQ